MSTLTNQSLGKELFDKEFKQSFLFASRGCTDEQPFVVFKAVCAMLNKEGGEVLIGVDNYGRILPGEHEGIKGDIRKLNNKHINDGDSYARYIRNRIGDYFYDGKYVRDIVDVQESEKYDNVIRIIVRKADRIVYMHRIGNNERLAFRREGAASNLMDGTMINQRKADLCKERSVNQRDRRIERIRLQLQEAIELKRKVSFGYCSSNSDRNDNRIVEPIEFILDGRSIWAYEEKNEGNDPLRQFKLSRILRVEVLDEPCEHFKDYKEPYIDAFEWSRSTVPSIPISIMVGPAAKNQLVEECPESVKYLKECGNQQWLLDTNVHSLEPVKRFCMMFKDSGSIVVYMPDELKRELGLMTETETVKETESTNDEVIMPLRDRIIMAARILIPGTRKWNHN